MTLPNPQRHVVPTVVLTKSKFVPLSAARQVTTVVSPTNVTRPRPAKTVVTKPHSPPRRHINRSPSPKASTFPLKVTAAKAPMVNVVMGNWGNPQHALKDKGVINSGCPRHMTGNMSYLSDFEEINGGYVAFSGNPKGGKIFGKDTECLVLSPEFKLPDENQVLLRVPRENNMYNVDLKNIISSGDLTCLFAKATLDKSNLWHRRPGHINFKTMNKLVKGKFNGKADEGFLVRYLVSSKAFRVFNSRTRIMQETLHINFLENKPNVAGNGPTWLFDIDTLTKTMNYQPVTAGSQSNPSACVQEQFDAEKARDDNVQQYVLFPIWFSGFKNPQNTDDDAAFKGEKPESEVHVSPSSKFEDFFDNSINEVNVVDSPVLTVRQISTNNTNTFSAAGPSNTAVSPTHRKSSYVNTSQYPDDLNMPELEDITYFDDEEDVGAEADFTNLSMTRVAKDQGGLSQINNDDFHSCMFACFLSQEEPKRVHQALKDPSWIEAMKEELLQFKMQKEEGIDYEEDFAPVVSIEAIRLFLAYASFMGFMVYQMDVKSAFLYRTIEKEVYVYQPPGFEDPDYPDKLQFEKLFEDDAESLDCLPNEEIFTELSRMGCEKPSTKLTFYKAFFLPQRKFLIHTILQCMSTKRMSWNEFSSSMALAVICLLTGRKFNFSKYIFDSLVRNVERRNKLKVSKLRILKRVGTSQRVDTSEDTVMDYVSKQGKIIANIDANEDVTLADVDVVAKEVEVEKTAKIDENADVQGRQAESQAQIYQFNLKHADKVLSMQDDEVEPAELQEVVEVVTTTKLMTEVVTAANATITATTTSITVAAITAALSAAKRRKGVEIRDPEETATPSIIIHSEPKSKDKRKGIMVEEPKPLKKQAQIEQDEAYRFNSNVAFLEKTREQIEEEDSKTLKRTSESQAEKAAKKQKLDEEVEELKKHLQIVPNDEDDVYTEATPLARKVPVVDYEIYTENNKPYYKIIRADGSPQLFLSFLSLLKNFNREELEVLWQLVRERFASSKPKNFSNDFLLTTFTYMFEKPDV
uniref:Uncharacterized protein n=1 Tax=Tanacetum cinerariifolium TaxID=118510 RepID=A0A6L2KSW0_TANCI|nr:hypothetical protein [Tanacetum cinerariifolium]